jgi:hypothetical protein
MSFRVFYFLYRYTSDLALAYDDDNRTSYKRTRPPSPVHHLRHSNADAVLRLAGHRPTRRHSPSSPPRGERGKAKVI